MAEVLNEYSTSVFNTEYISSLPVPFTKFEGNSVCLTALTHPVRAGDVPRGAVITYMFASLLIVNQDSLLLMNASHAC